LSDRTTTCPPFDSLVGLLKDIFWLRGLLHEGDVKLSLQNEVNTSRVSVFLEKNRVNLIGICFRW